ncbi:MAG: cob(I)yrinic acid a,c-diamide adenosyltransferase [Sulfobacillus sp.]
MAGKIYTRRGDQGQTRLATGERVAKHSDRVAAYGMLYELNSFLGHARAQLKIDRPDPTPDLWNHLEISLKELQHRLFRVGGDLSRNPQQPKPVATLPEHTEALERLIDQLRDASPPWRPFTLPEGTLAATDLYICTTVCRRAEREILRLNHKEPVPKPVLTFINRLSDAFFASARYVNFACGISEEPTREPEGY